MDPQLPTQPQHSIDDLCNELGALRVEISHLRNDLSRLSQLQPTLAKPPQSTGKPWYRRTSVHVSVGYLIGISIAIYLLIYYHR